MGGKALPQGSSYAARFSSSPSSRVCWLVAVDKGTSEGSCDREKRLVREGKKGERHRERERKRERERDTHRRWIDIYFR